MNEPEYDPDRPDRRRRPSLPRMLWFRCANWFGYQRHRLGRVVHAVRRHSLGRWLHWLASIPINWLYGLLYFARRAWRRYWQPKARHLLYGIPSLLLLVGAGYLSAAILTQSKEDIAVAYQVAAEEAFHDRDYERARIYLDRVASQNQLGPESLFQLALCLSELGQHQRLELLIEELAPAEKAGFGPAHYWQANRMLMGGELTPPEFRTAELHLQRALGHPSVREQAHGMLGQLFLATGRYEKAVEHFEAVVAKHPDLLAKLAQAHAFAGHHENARRIGTLARDYYQARVERDATDKSAWLQWAESCRFLEQFSEAIDILREGEQLFPDAEDFRPAISNVYLTWAENPGSQHTDEQRIRLLLNALVVHPHDLRLFAYLGRVLETPGDDSDALRKTLYRMLTTGMHPGVIHLLLGTDAWGRGDKEAGRRHLELAVELEPDSWVMANNLAYYLTFSDEPDLETALTVVESIPTRHAENPFVRDTRGQILTKMGRYQEALPHLVAALPNLGDSEERLHRALAEVYGRLEMAELSAEHLRQAEALGRSPDKKPTNKLRITDIVE